MAVRFVNVSLPACPLNTTRDTCAALTERDNRPAAEVSETTTFAPCWRTSAESLPTEPTMEITRDARS
jgi:hypothetical protein